MADSSFFDLMDFMQRPSIYAAFVDILLCTVPIWVAVMIGLVIGWSWRPRWTGIVFLGLRSRFRFLCTAPPGFGARRLWLALTALSAFSVCRTVWFNFRKDKESETVSDRSEMEMGSGASTTFEVEGRGGCQGENIRRDQELVTEKDLEHLLSMIDKHGEGLIWQNLMERCTPHMSYQAWRHEPESGPTVYHSKTVFEDATPEVVRDFFWDDEFRPKWDPMLAHFNILEEYPDTGASVVHWIKKFPFFCSDREYVIGRKIWEAGKIHYCVTKGVPYPSLPKREKPHRVDLYFSSWIIRPVESRKGDGQFTACEVSLVHYEDMGIPKDVAKLGVRHGMWGTVKKLHSGVRAYQNMRKTGALPSRYAQLAKLTASINFDDSNHALGDEQDSKIKSSTARQKNPDVSIDWKWMVVGGTVALVCALHTNAMGKALVMGAAQRIARSRR
uniref:START domain-containing protein n=1 Tax=Kalanchoe fedtschenkoi TaxID=63787 RepID=A0A7N0UU31_KALFE